MSVYWLEYLRIQMCTNVSTFNKLFNYLEDKALQVDICYSDFVVLIQCSFSSSKFFYKQLFTIRNLFSLSLLKESLSIVLKIEMFF